MKHVTRTQTFDGALHLNDRDAKAHLEKVYGDLLLNLARKLANQNYTFTSDFIDANLSEFIALDQVKRDMALTNEWDE